jgi:uncharacterized protein
MAQKVETRAPVAASGPVTLGDPGPLGLSAFALTTFVLSVINAGIIVPHPGSNLTIFIGLAVFYGGIAQFAAGMWEFRSGNTFGGTAFTSYAAFWLSFAALFIPGFGVKLLDLDPAVGLYLLGWTIFTALLMIASFRLNGALAAVFVLLFVTFAALTIGALGKNATWSQIGGWLGILTALAAWYTAFAGVLRGVSGGAVQLPIFPFTKGWGR